MKADSCSGGGDHSTQCAIGVASAGFAGLGATGALTARVSTGVSTSAQAGAGARLSLNGVLNPVRRFVTGPALDRVGTGAQAVAQTSAAIGRGATFAGLGIDVPNYVANYGLR